MVSPRFFYQLALIALVWLCVMLQWVWPSAAAAACPTALSQSCIFEAKCENRVSKNQ